VKAVTVLSAATASQASRAVLPGPLICAASVSPAIVPTTPLALKLTIRAPELFKKSRRVTAAAVMPSSPVSNV
jgi:hypothetical protein